MLQQPQQQTVSTGSSSSDNNGGNGGGGPPIDLAKESFSANQRPIAEAYKQNPSAGATALGSVLPWIVAGLILAALWWLFAQEPRDLTTVIGDLKRLGGPR